MLTKYYFEDSQKNNHIKHLISPNQSGFLPNHSAVSLLLEIHHQIYFSGGAGKRPLRLALIVLRMYRSYRNTIIRQFSANVKWKQPFRNTSRVNLKFHPGKFYE
jgi:hypothetical protein